MPKIKKTYPDPDFTYKIEMLPVTYLKLASMDLHRRKVTRSDGRACYVTWAGHPEAHTEESIIAEVAKHLSSQ
jgi:hypothetical protein